MPNRLADEYETTPPLSFDGMKAIAADLTYKPGWEFVVHENPLRIQVYTMAADNFVKNAPVLKRTTTRQTAIPANYNEGQLVQAFLREIEDVEKHETRETFKYRKKRIKNPHFDPTALIQHLVTQAQTPRVPEPILTPRGISEVIAQTESQGYTFTTKYVQPLSYLEGGLVDKVAITVAFENAPDAQLRDDAHIGKKITFITTPKETNVVNNLFDAIWAEQLKEVQYRFRYKGFSPYSNETPVGDFLAFRNPKQTFVKPELKP